jgi:hypothetical protein
LSSLNRCRLYTGVLSKEGQFDKARHLGELVKLSYLERCPFFTGLTVLKRLCVAGRERRLSGSKIPGHPAPGLRVLRHGSDVEDALHDALVSMPLAQGYPTLNSSCTPAYSLRSCFLFILGSPAVNTDASLNPNS